MELKLYCPSLKMVDEAKEQGIDLVGALKIIANYAIKDAIDGSLEWISFDVDKKQCIQLKEYNIDVPSHLAGAYICEMVHQLDKEYVKDGKEIKLEPNKDEFNSAKFIKRMKETLDSIDIPEWKHIVVTNAQVGCAIEALPELEITSLNKSDSMERIYTIGKYNKDIEVKVDPYMSWDDCRLICIL